MAKILGVKIDNYTLQEVMEKITYFLNSKGFHQIATVNPEFIVAAQYDSDFKKILNQTDFNVADGFGLKIAAMITSQKIGQRLTGVDLTYHIAKIAAQNGYSMFLLGAGEGVAEKAARKLRKDYPRLKIVGTFSGGPNDKDTFKAIKKAKPNILLVAFGAPKQEKFIYSLKNLFSDLGFRISDLHLAMGVGGTFGLEWLCRLFRQPSRIGRIYTAVIKFPLMVIFKGSKS